MKYDQYLSTRPNKTGTLVPPPPQGTVINPPRTELITADNIEQVFRDISPDLQADTINLIGVFSSPLSAPFGSSTTTVRGYLQQQFLPFDYHAFVVLETSEGKFCAVEKQTDGIHISWSDCIESVLFNFDKESRPLPIKLLIEDKSNSNLYDVMQCLKHNIPQNLYDVDQQCQHFAKEIFGKFAAVKFWDASLPADLTSPLTLLSNRGRPLLFLIHLACIITELYLLFSDSTVNTGSRQFAGFSLLLGLLVLVLSIKTGHLNEGMLNHLGGVTLLLVLCALILECIFSTPLGAYRKRGALYTEMFKSESTVSRCWSTFCFGMIYTSTMWACFGFLPLLVLQDLLKYLTTHVPVLSPVLVIVTWLFDYIRNMGGTANIITLYVVTWFYFSLLS